MISPVFVVDGYMSLVVEASSQQEFDSVVCYTVAFYLGSYDSLLYAEISSTSAFVLPDCFWTSTTATLDIVLTRVTIRGKTGGSSGASGPGATNPFARFPTTLKTLTLLDCVLSDPTQVQYKADLSPVSAWGDLITLELRNTNLGGGSLFPNILSPYLTNLIINTCNLAGTIPTTLFASTSFYAAKLDLSNNALTGSLPSAFVSSNTALTFELNLSNNQLSGSIPPNFLTSKPSSAVSLIVNLGNNSLTGSLPSGFLPSAGPSMYGGPSLSLNVSANQLSGSLPAEFATTNFLTQANVNALKSFTFLAAGNRLSGKVPSFLEHLQPPNHIFTFDLDLSNNEFTSLSTSGLIPNASWPMNVPLDVTPNAVSLRLNSNLLAGPIPTDLFETNALSFYLGLGDNLLTGTVPEGLMANLEKSLDLSVSLAGNSLTGTLPSQLFTNANRTSFAFDVSRNPLLGGAIPSELGNILSLPSLTGEVRVNLGHCAFSGTIPQISLPSQLMRADLNFESNQLTTDVSGVFNLSSFLFSDQASTRESFYLGLNIADNKFTGELDATGLPLVMEYKLQFQLNASFNGWTGLVMDESWVESSQVIDVSHTPMMTTITVPDLLFSTNSLKALFMSGTGLTGPLPQLKWNSALASIDLSNNTMDFCSQRDPWTGPTSILTLCVLTNTNANLCPALYPSVCQYSAVPVTPPTTPSSPIAGVPITHPNDVPSATNAPGTAPDATPSITPSNGEPSAPNAPGTVPDADVPITPSNGVPSATNAPGTAPTLQGVPTGDVSRNLVPKTWMAMGVALIALAAFI